MGARIDFLLCMCGGAYVCLVLCVCYVLYICVCVFACVCVCVCVCVCMCVLCIICVFCALCRKINKWSMWITYLPSIQRHTALELVMYWKYQDPVDDVYYDVLLTIVDVQHGQYGINNFYRMQIIHEKVMNACKTCVECL